MSKTEAKFHIELENTGPDGPNLDKPDDFTKETKKYLGNYLARITKEGGNSFRIKGGEPVTSVLHDEYGNPVALNHSPEGAVTTIFDNFSEEDRAKAIAQQTQYANSGLFNIRFKKGKVAAPKNVPDGHSLLQNLEKTEYPTDIDRVLRENNFASPESPYVDENLGVDEDNTKVGAIIRQDSVGVHAPRKFPTSVQEGKNNVYTIKELKNLGYQLMVKAGGKKDVPRNPSDQSERADDYIRAMIPSPVALGVEKIKMGDVRPINVFKEQNPTFDKPTINSYGDGADSYGSPYNFASTFAGLTAGPSVVLAGIMITTLGIVVNLLSLALKTNSPTDTDIPNRPEERKRFLGSYLGRADMKFLGKTEDYLNVVITKNSFTHCVTKGFNVFFDLDSDSIGGAILGAAGRVLTIHGYYNTVIRNIIRSGADVASMIGDAFSIGTQNPIEIFSLAFKINSMPIVKFINILAMIGDSAITAEEPENRVEDIPDTEPTNRFFETILRRGTNLAGPTNLRKPAAVFAKSRLSDGVNAWSQSTTPSLFIWPENIDNAASTFKAQQKLDNDKAFGKIIKNNLVQNGGTKGRIPQELVRRMEDFLEMDFMPFYFHDLRTNEIISFHAFIESIEDSFSAEYTETEGYGRPDKVQTYKGTSRSVSLAFHVVSFSPDDFDDMWWKINKLVTLVYPQWSKGRQLKYGQNRFIQPFSQYPSASPLMRLRLGDIIKSNYSKFAVARLFGISNNPDQFFFEDMQRTGTASELRIQREIREGIQQRSEGLRNLIQNYGDLPRDAIFRLAASPARTTRPRGYEAVDSVSTTITAPARRGRNPVRPNSTEDTSLVVLGTETRVVVVGKTPGTGNSNYYNVNVINPGEGQEGTYKVPYASILIDEEDISRKIRIDVLRRNGSPSAEIISPQSVQDFLNPEQNPIFKAFETTEGRGLAGVMKTLRFDYSNVTWETEMFNGRAPRMLKINIDFTPIHDVAPGIDWSGFNTAPTHNVGRILQPFGEKPASDIETIFTQDRSATFRRVRR